MPAQTENFATQPQDPAKPSAPLSIAIVLYKPNLQQFAQVLKSLELALQAFVVNYAGPVRLVLVDNTDQDGYYEARSGSNDRHNNKKKSTATAVLHNLVTSHCPSAQLQLILPQQNLGYGRAHNLALAQADSRYHLILNPDVVLSPAALVNGVNLLEHNVDIVALSPAASDGDKHKLHLCKRHPAVFDLALRGFAPAFVRNRFAQRMAHYEHHALANSSEVVGEVVGEVADVDLISGCFMLCRTSALQQVGGFNPAFFLYFEDFALSRELQKVGRLVYYPACKIIHYGGGAGQKGFKHICYFMASAVKFYALYGWKLF